MAFSSISYLAILHRVRFFYPDQNILNQGARRAPKSCPSALIIPTSFLHTSHRSACPIVLRIDDACLHSSSSSFFLIINKWGRRAPRRAPKSWPSALIIPTSFLHTSHRSACPIVLRIDDACLHSSSSSFFFINKGGRRAPRRAPKSWPSAVVMPKYSYLALWHTTDSRKFVYSKFLIWLSGIPPIPERPSYSGISYLDISATPPKIPEYSIS